MGQICFGSQERSILGHRNVLSDRHHFRFARMTHCFQKVHCLFLFIFTVLIINFTRQKTAAMGTMGMILCQVLRSFKPDQPFEVPRPSLLWIRSDEGLTLEASASESLYGGQFTLSTQLIKPNYLVILPPTQRHSFFRNLPPSLLCLPGCDWSRDHL